MSTKLSEKRGKYQCPNCKNRFHTIADLVHHLIYNCKNKVKGR